MADWNLLFFLIKEKRKRLIAPWDNMLIPRKLQECGGGFQDGKFFTRDDEEIPVCVGCEERRLKSYVVR